MDEDDQFGEDDELDDLLVSVLEDSTGLLPSAASAELSSVDDVAFTGDGPSGLVDGFDADAGRSWIYPTNKEMREYQYNIVRRALLANTLVCLPTGLGKTFIAAVLMYNFYRWFPRGKVLFMAPTKPLVAQQIEACFEVMGIPQAHMSEMTGSMVPNDRRLAWKEKRVFFLTPQVISNDISRGICPAMQVKCVVVDEAHKALGNHSYVQVVRDLRRHNAHFRVLALSATPGSDSRQVQQVITNLLIAHIEIRSEDSAEIVPYTHTRLVEKVVVPLGEELSEIKAQFVDIMSVYVDRLHSRGVLCTRNSEALSKYMMLKERDCFRQNPPQNLPQAQFGVIEGDFALSLSLLHAFDLLLFYGTRSFYVYFQDILHGDKGMPRTRFELQHNVTFCRLMDRLRQKYGDANEAVEQLSAAPRCSYSHPKFQKLEEIVLDHFRVAKESMEPGPGTAQQGTRIIVFAQYRESVREIESVLNRHRPHVRPTVLLGQAHATRGAKGFRQKLQLEAMKQFCSGACNVLVSTCIGEEGLDIGDVDLIVCFDAQKSPIRLVQRMGRTGRKRDGRVVVLMTKGKEEKIHNQGQYNSRAVSRTAERSARNYELYRLNARMIPTDVEPVCHKMCLASEKFVHAGKGAAKRAVGRDRRTVSPPYLSDEHLSEWLSRYAVAPEDTPSLDRLCGGMLSLKSAEGRGVGHAAPRSTRRSHPSGRNLSLSDWLPWQNAPNPTFAVAHSERSKLLVDTMRRLELVAQLSPESVREVPVAASEGVDDVSVRDGPLSKFVKPNAYGTRSRANGGRCGGLASTAKGSKSAKESTSAVAAILESDETSSRQRSLNGDTTRKRNPTVSSSTSDVSRLSPEDDTSDFMNVSKLTSASPEEFFCEQDVDGASPSFFDTAFKQQSINGYWKPRRGSNSASACGKRLCILTPPPTSPPDVALDGDWLEDIGVDSPTVDAGAKTAAVCDLDDRGATPLGGGVFKTPVVPDSRMARQLTDSGSPFVPCEESLYSMTQLVGMIDVDSFELPPEEQTSRSVNLFSSVPPPPRMASRSISDALALGGVDDDDEPWDSDDDLFASCDVVLPSPVKPASGRLMNFLKPSLVLPPEASTSTPLHVEAHVSSSSSSTENTCLHVGATNTSRMPMHMGAAGTKRSSSDSPASDDSMRQVRRVRRRNLQRLELCTQDVVQGPNGQRHATKTIPSAVLRLDGKVRHTSYNPLSQLQWLTNYSSKAISCHGGGREFLLEEAEVSDDASVSEDESIGNVEFLGGSFIDDDNSPSQGETNTGMYLRSVKSPRVMAGAFVLDRGGHGTTDSDDDAYSQSPFTQDPDYLCDSFCVANDVVDVTPQKRRRLAALRDTGSGSDTSPDLASRARRVVAPDEEPTGRSSTTSSSTPGSLLQSPPPGPAHVPEASVATKLIKPSPVTILVDSREVSSSQDIITELRLGHGVQVQVVPLGNCDYIVSKRLAVERKTVSDFADSTFRSKLTDRLSGILRNFERACLIIEKDRVRPKEHPKTTVMTRYLASILACLVDTSIRIIWTKSHAHTAEVLFDLARREANSNHAINVPLEPVQRAAFAFYQKLVPNNYVAALYFCAQFRSVRCFINSCADDIHHCGVLPREMANYVHRRARQTFL